jgi:large subunit ribosomal protein L25
MTISFEFNAQLRDCRGKAGSRRMRRLEDIIPAVIYGLKKEPVAISLTHKDIMHALEKEEFYSQIIMLNVAGKSEQVVLKDLQRHPFKPRIIHVDFLRISAKEKIVMHVPVHLLGVEQCVGLKAGGVLSHIQTEIEISCLPADLPTHIDIDIRALEIDSSIHLTEVKLPKGVVLAHAVADEEHDHAVVAVHAPRDEESESTGSVADKADGSSAEAKDSE